MRGFKKISIENFINSTNLTEEIYHSYNLPKRSTKHSAGYDFEVLEDFTINPGEQVLVKTGVKAYMQPDEVLMLFIRSSLGVKYNLRLCNQVGIIDSDYYDNPDNEGHILVCIKNEGSEPKVFKRGERIVQGVFTKFLVSDEEMVISKSRCGGFGSTNGGEKRE